MDEREARSVTLLLFEKLCGLSTADLLSGKADVLSAESMHRMEEAVRRVADGEPVQYVVGRADFMDMELEVNPSVLISPDSSFWHSRSPQRSPEQPEFYTAITWLP